MNGVQLALSVTLLTALACGEVADPGDSGAAASGGSGGDLASGGAFGSGGSGGSVASGGTQAVGGSGGVEALGGFAGAPAERAPDFAEAFCFDANEIPLCSGNASPPFVLQLASDIAPDAHFLGMGQLAALLEIPSAVGDERYRVVSTNVGSLGEVEVQGVTFPDDSPDWELRHVWEKHDTLTWPFDPQERVGLACTPEGCQLLAAATGDAALVALADTDLPAGVDHLVGQGERLCAYGETLLCWDGEAFIEVADVPADGSTRFAKVVLESAGDGFEAPAVAITDGGAFLVEGEDGNWTVEAEALPDDVLLSLESYWGIVLALYESGTVQAFDSAGFAEHRCQGAEHLRFVMAQWGTADGKLFAVDDAGRTFTRDSDAVGFSWCVREPLPGLEVETRAGCGMVSRTFGTTPDAFYSLFGEPICLAS